MGEQLSGEQNETREGVENAAEVEEPGEIVEAAERGDRFFAKGTLLKDGQGRLAQVVDYVLVDDPKTDWYKEDDSSIQQPTRYVNPEITIQYADGTRRTIKALSKECLTPLCNDETNPIKEDEEFFELSHFELRGHDYKLGEMVSYGRRRVGRLALISPGEKPQFGIIGRQRWGKPGPFHFWLVDVTAVDFVEYDGGRIKVEDDGYTIFKPTLGKE